MSYEISIPKSKKYVHCRIKKSITAEFSREFTLKVEQYASKYNILNILYDSRGYQNVEKIHRTYQYTYEDMKTLGLNRATRVAMLVSPDDKSHDFVEVVCRNAGYNVKLFRNKNKAVKWFEEYGTVEKQEKKAKIEIGKIDKVKI